MLGTIIISFLISHIFIYLLSEKVIKVWVFIDLFLPGRTLEFLIHLYNVLEVVKSKFPRTHVHNKLGQKIQLHVHL